MYPHMYIEVKPCLSVACARTTLSRQSRETGSNVSSEKCRQTKAVRCYDACCSVLMTVIGTRSWIIQ